MPTRVLAPEQGLPELLEIATTRRNPTAERVSALGALARRSPSLEPLLDLTADDDPRVRVAAVDVLGRRGSVDVLDRLRRVDRDVPEPLLRRLDLASALVAHRVGLPDGPFLPAVDAVPRELGPETDVEVHDLDDFAPPFELLDPDGYGVEPSTAVEIPCAPGAHLVFLDRRGQSEQVFRRPLLLGVVAFASSGSTSVEFLVLSRPWEHGARLEVARPDGLVALVGTAVPVDGGFSFEITDTGARGVRPTRVVGRVGDRLSIESAQQARRGRRAVIAEDARPPGQ